MCLYVFHMSLFSVYIQINLISSRRYAVYYYTFHSVFFDTHYEIVESSTVSGFPEHIQQGLQLKDSSRTTLHYPKRSTSHRCHFSVIADASPMNISIEPVANGEPLTLHYKTKSSLICFTLENKPIVLPAFNF